MPTRITVTRLGSSFVPLDVDTPPEEDVLEGVYDLDDPQQEQEYHLALDLIRHGGSWVLETSDGAMWLLEAAGGGEEEGIVPACATGHCAWPQGGVTGEGFFA